MTRTLIILAIGLLVLTNLYTIKQRNYYKAKTSNLTQEKSKADSLYMWQSEKLLKHVLISLELNEIVDKFQSSRNEKLKNKELINKMNEL